MNDTRTRVNEGQRNIEPVRQPQQEPARQHEQRPVQLLAPQATYRRAQVNRNELTPANLLALQRTVGNSRVQRLLLQREIRLQTKLTVGLAGDQYEQEADAVAKQVMSMPDAATQRPIQVKPTMQMKDGVPVNDDQGLEHEADVMGAKALQRVVNLIQLEKLKGTNLELSTHAKERMVEYNFDSAFMKDVIENGTAYSDSRPEHAGQTIYYKDEVAIAVKGGTITTVMNRARVKKEWTPK